MDEIWAPYRKGMVRVAAVVGLVVNVALNLWLIPALSYEGAALATLASTALVVVVIWVPLSRLGAVGPPPLRTLAHAVAGGVLSLLTALAVWSVLPWPAAAAAG
ncbi:MAG TPA: polysaccharide biosynthesis C-terminal domain-containing protein, partial [Acidimicrobiales bacterium]|nr:polysaccharide biosynthesis C-terminal domain-containing protein [Acidimicrobiales bacterium]